MKKLKAIIVDDEHKSRQIIADILTKYCSEIEIISECASGDEAYLKVLESAPDLVLLDIQMPFGNGFELLSKFDVIPFDVIFITAFDQYAIKAIRASAVDYLLKPVSIHELKAAISKVIQRYRDKQAAQQYQSLMQNLRLNQGNVKKLAVPISDGLDFIETTHIIKLEADGGYTTIYSTGSKKTVSTRNLKEYEEILPANHFFRVHHSHIINLQHIKQYHKGDGGYVVMSDQSTVDISKRKKKDFLELFQA